MIYLDTHVVVWLYLPRLELLSARARELPEEEKLYVSPAVLLELQYLHEIERLSVSGGETLANLASRIGLRTCDLPFATVTESATEHSWTRDPFDRLIAGQAAAKKQRLLTRDERIRQLSKAVW